MPKLPRSTSSATSSMASGTIPSRPAKPHPDRLKIMHLFPDRWAARGRAPSWRGNGAPVLGAGGERSILLGGGRLEAERHWVIQSRPTDRSALFPGTVLCCRRSRRARAAVSDIHAAQRPPPFLLNHRWWRWTLSLNDVPVWTCTRPVSFAVF